MIADLGSWWDKIVDAVLAFPYILIGLIVGGLVLSITASIIFGKRKSGDRGS